MINGEPTEKPSGDRHQRRSACGTNRPRQDGAFGYPELGESAIDKLVEALHRLHAMKLAGESRRWAMYKERRFHPRWVAPATMWQTPSVRVA